MNELIEQRLMELQKRVEDFRIIITAINNDIESGRLLSFSLQQAQIDYTTSEGRKALKEIERLEMLYRL